MKVSILTQPLGHNYGGLLQAYALQVYLKSIGCEVETLDRRAPESLSKTLKNLSLNLARLALGRIKSLPTRKKHEFIFHNLVDFRNNYLEMSERITSEAELRNYYSQHVFDVVIVGSDQVWRPKYSPSIQNYYLDFLDDINSKARRVSYAASFGVSNWEYTEKTTRICKSLIKKFNAVSVREQSAIDLCKEHFGITPEWAVDPTLLLEVEQYENLLQGDNTTDNFEQILTYFIDPSVEKQKVAKKMSDTQGKKLFSVSPEKKVTHVHTSELEQCKYPTVETWLKGFKEASFVVTDSFHGCVFAILFNKPFIAVGNPRRGLARFDSLLAMFELENRLVCTPDELSLSILKSDINWERVNRIRLEQAEISKVFLLKNLY